MAGSDAVYHNVTTSSFPASCLMSPGPDSGFSQTAASARTPGRRISSDRVASAFGDEPVVEAGIQGECRHCVEVLIRLVSRWGAA